MIGQVGYRFVIMLSLAGVLPLRPLAADEAFRLIMTGSANLPFTADCRLVDGRGFEHWANLRGAVPQGYLLPGAAAACEVRKEDRRGYLRVQLQGPLGTVAEGATRSRFGEVAVRSDGPWGPRQATVTTEPLLTVPPFPSPGPPGLGGPSVPIVPPLKGQTVPPLR